MAVLELSSFEMMNSHKNALGSYQCLLAFGDEYELVLLVVKVLTALKMLLMRLL